MTIKKIFAIIFTLIIPLQISASIQSGNFTQRTLINFTGNVKVIGNSVLQDVNSAANNAARRSNVDVQLSYINIDTANAPAGVNIFNSSSATIGDSLNGVNVNNSRIVWAGLYWSGYLHDNDNDPGEDNVYNFTPGQGAVAQTIQNHTVYIKMDNGQYIAVPVNESNSINNPTSGAGGVSYSAFADVSSIFTSQSTSINHKFTVANIPTRSGETRRGNNGDALGTSGAWALVLIYDNSSESNEKTRNVTVFDGLQNINAQNNPNVTVNFTGFKTPSQAPDGVDSVVSVFTAEGDRYINGDDCSITNQDGNSASLNTQTGPINYFNSTVTGVNNRNPVILNNNGIDIHSIQVGTVSGGLGIISTDHTSASLTFTSQGDTYFPTLVVFSTELFRPKICYDYSLMDGNYTNLDDQGRNFFKVANEQPLKVKVTIRSQQADFNLTNSKLTVDFSKNAQPSNDVTYIPGSAQYTIPNTHVFTDAVEVDATKGIIAVGSNANSNGGTIGPLETYYTIQSFNVNSDFNGSFDLNLTSTIQLSATSSVDYTMSTEAGTFPRCATNPTYDPVYWNFNIERSSASGPNRKRFSLPTQVSGRPYKIAFASYSKNNHYGNKQRATTVAELELINAGSFENNSSVGYDTVCEDPSNITQGAFIRLDNEKRKVINIPEDYTNYPMNIAMKNATFRMWFLVKKENNNTTIVNHGCDIGEDQCFKTLYNSKFKSYDKLKVCDSACSNGECYQCLKKYFSKPVCARDNFAIRPKSYKIVASDYNKTTPSTKKTVGDNSATNSGSVNFVSDYLYRLDINATVHGNDNAKAIGYFLNPNNNPNLMFVPPTGTYTCNDTNDSSLNIYLLNGSTPTYVEDNSTINKLKIANAGLYNLHIEDNDWTLVDQTDYAYKTFSNIEDCIRDSSKVQIVTSNRLQGCKIDSNNVQNGYKDLQARSYPYRYDINNTRNYAGPVDNNKSIVFINTLSSAVYPNGYGNNRDYMAYNIRGSFKAVSYTGRDLTNFTEHCYADRTDVKIESSYVYGAPANTPQITNDFVARDDNNQEITSSTVDKNVSNITADYTKNYFPDFMNGKSNIELSLNYKREFNKPINPRVVYFKDLNITEHNNPANLYVNQASHIISGYRSIDKNITFIYARALPKKKFYDDVSDANVTTPIYVALYCSLSTTQCADMNVTINNDSQTRDTFWYKGANSVAVDNVVDLRAPNNNIYLSDSANANPNSHTITAAIDANGANESLNVRRMDPPVGFSLPTTVEIRGNNLSRWLIYNEFANTQPAYLYRVRFINPPNDWTGVGKTGHTIGNKKGQGKKTRKVDW